MQGDIGVANVLLTSLGVNENPRMHESKFFKYPINYLDFERNKDPNLSPPDDVMMNIADNDYSTFETLTSAPNNRYTINITDDGMASGNATEFTHIFIKCLNATQINIIPSGGTHVDEIGISIPETVVNYYGRDVRINPDGFQNFLHESYDRVSDDKPTAQTLTIEFTGTGVRVYEIMILDEVLFLESNRQFTQVDYKLADRSSIIQKDLADRITKVPGINEDRWKWDTDYTALLLGENINNIDPDLDTYNKIINFIKNRVVSNNFVFMGEPSAYPERIAPCTFPNPDIQLAFLSRFKESGETLKFTIMEL